MAETATKASTWVSGICGIGLHEGEKHRNHTGQPLAFCRGQWETHAMGVHTQYVCNCKCHKGITEMYEMVGRERVWPASGKWWRDDDPGIKPREKYWGPWMDPTWKSNEADPVKVKASEVVAEKAAKGELTPMEMRIMKAIQAGLLPPNTDYIAARRDRPDESSLTLEAIKGMGLTPSEHAAKMIATEGGTTKQVRAQFQLEFQVKQVCDQWVLGFLPDTFELTSGAIAKLIDPQSPPSTGAITNVLKRWDEIGFAIHRTEPHRFEGYTEEGIQKGANGLRAQAERRVASMEAEKARRFVTPKTRRK